MTTEKIILAAGCFWGVQHILDEIKGVVATRCGYIGGQTVNPNYRDICTGETGHAEAVEVEFDPHTISLSELLNYFWRLHDPTQVNRQGVDIGTQYRSAIFYFTDEQKRLAEKSKDEFDAAKVFNRKSVTEIRRAPEFFEAEEYHQKYFTRNGGHVCHVLRSK